MSYMYICHCLQVQVWLSATFAMTLRGGGGGGSANFLAIVWKYPLSVVFAPGRQHCILTVVLHWLSHASCTHDINLQEIFWLLSFEIYGKWSVQTNQLTNSHAHTCAQCSHASVGLTHWQARPNYHRLGSFHIKNNSWDKFSWFCAIHEISLTVDGYNVDEHLVSFWCLLYM